MSAIASNYAVKMSDMITDLQPLYVVVCQQTFLNQVRFQKFICQVQILHKKDMIGLQDFQLSWIHPAKQQIHPCHSTSIVHTSHIIIHSSILPQSYSS